jgi:hypothetical protein
MDKNVKILGKSTVDGSLPRTKTAADKLPPADTKRWTPRRKASVVGAVLSGTISLEEVFRRHDLSGDEFLSWQNAMERHGVLGLYTTKIQKYRYSPVGRSNGTATGRLSNPT